jgi:hypothetical protein
MEISRKQSLVLTCAICTLITLLIVVFLSGCAAKLTPPEQSAVANVAPFPQSPNWVSVVKNPIKDITPEGDYIVDKTLVQWATQARLWVPRVEKWIDENNLQ